MRSFKSNENIHKKEGGSYYVVSANKASSVTLLNLLKNFSQNYCTIIITYLYSPLTKEKKDRSSPCGTNKSSFISGLKYISMNINSIRGKKLELLAFLDFHQPHVVAIQETKINSSIATSELFPETCPYSVYRKDRNIHGGGVMLLVHKDISHMPNTELENDSESIWVKVFANKTYHFVASWYRPPGSTSGEFQLFREQLDYIRTHHKGKKATISPCPRRF